MRNQNRFTVSRDDGAWSVRDRGQVLLPTETRRQARVAAHLLETAPKEYFRRSGSLRLTRLYSDVESYVRATIV